MIGQNVFNLMTKIYKVRTPSVHFDGYVIPLKPFCINALEIAQAAHEDDIINLILTKLENAYLETRKAIIKRDPLPLHYF